MCLAALLAPSRLHAQTAPPAGDSLYVGAVRFEGNVLYDDATLALLVRTRANRRFLGVPGLTWWLWLYRAGTSGRFGRLGAALASLGEAPAYVDDFTLAADAERLAALFQQEGYRSATVGVRVDTLRATRLRVTFEIAPGPATFLRRVSYDLGGALAPDERAELARRSLLQPGAPAPDSLGRVGFRARGQRYSEGLLLEERRRLLTFLRDRGFAAVTRDSIRALVFPLAADSFDVTFRVRAGEKFGFGPLDVAVQGPEETAAARADTLEGAFPTAIHIAGERRLKPGLVGRALRMRPGAGFSQSRVLASKQRLEATGLFTFTGLTPLWRDTFRVEGRPFLPYRIELRTRPRHTLRFETFALQRSGILAGSDSELGTGAGATYENLNLLGGGESLRLRTAGSVSADIEGGLFTSGQLESSATLTLPYLPRGLEGLAPRSRTPRTQISASALTARRDDLGLAIRARLGARLRLELPHSATLQSVVDVFDVSLSDPDTLGRFTTFLDGFLDEISDPLQRAQLREEILENYTRPQVNTAVRYTLRSTRVNPLRREQGYYYQASASAGGYLEAFLDQVVFSPGVAEGSLPPLLGGRGRLRYRPYVRLTLDARRYRLLTPGTVLALKGGVGVAQATGQTGVVPFDQRFYSGGATSVRGWRLRELGPGAASFRNAGDVANVLGGDIWLETGVELRQTVIPLLFGAEWVGVAFADAGNVWLGPRNPGFGPGNSDGRFAFDRFYREIGVGSGLGLRLVWTYLVVRFDTAARVYDPASPGRLMPGGWRPLVHFGLGHAF